LKTTKVGFEASVKELQRMWMSKKSYEAKEKKMTGSFYFGKRCRSMMNDLISPLRSLNCTI